MGAVFHPLHSVALKTSSEFMQNGTSANQEGLTANRQSASTQHSWDEEEMLLLDPQVIIPFSAIFMDLIDITYPS